MSLDSITSDVEPGENRHTTIRSGEVLEIAALGGLALRCAERVVDVASRKAKALVAYLALAPAGTASREHLVGLLWSENDEARGRASLRQVVKALRTAFKDAGFDGLSIGRDEITLDTSALRLDVATVLQAVEDASVPGPLLERHRVADSLLAGYDDLDPSFRSWLLVQRQNLGQRLIRGLEAHLHDGGGDAVGKSAAEAIILLDPTHESACRRLIRWHAEAGDTAAALDVYNRLWHLLDEEYDAEPSEPTQELIAAVKLGDLKPAPVETLLTENTVYRSAIAPEEPEGRGPPTTLTVTVGHFDLDGIADAHKHVCVGFRSELIATLVRFRIWSIVDIRQTGAGGADRLSRGPRYLLHGHLYQDAENVYLVLELQDPASGVLVWSERFVLALDNYFAAQLHIVHKIAYSLNVHISLERLRQVSGRPDIDLDIYDRWLRGQHFVLSWQPELRGRAVEIFKSIIADAPDFAPAYSSLVSVLNSDHFVFPGVRRTDEVQREALRLAKKAVELDPLDSRSQLHLAWSQAMNGEYGIAELGFALACELNDNDPWTIASAAGGHAFCGGARTGYELSKRGLELAISPVPMVWAYTGCVRYINADFDGCIEACVQSEDEVVVMLAWKAAALMHMGRPGEAGTAFTRFTERVRANWHGEGKADNRAMTDWVVQCFPIRDRAILDDFRSRLRMAAGHAG